MTPAELRELRQSLDWSTAKAAKMFGVVPRTFTYWEQGVTSSGVAMPQVPTYAAITMLAFKFASDLKTTAKGKIVALARKFSSDVGGDE